MNKQKIHLDYLFTWVVKWCRMVGPLAQLCWQYTGLLPFVSAAIVCTHLISHKQNWEKGCGEGGIRRENAKALDLFLWDGSVTLHVILWKALCLSCVKFKLILHYIQIMYFLYDSVLRIQLEKPTLMIINENKLIFLILEFQSASKLRAIDKLIFSLLGLGSTHSLVQRYGLHQWR